MSLPRTTRLKLAILITTILMAVVAVLLVAMPNGVFAAAPERPTDLTATAVDHDTINLSWNHPDPASVDHYLILNRREGFGDGQLTQVGTSTTTSFVHDGLEPESTYFYRVKPVNAEGEEGQRSPRAEATTPAEETTEPEPTPERPTDLTATAIDHDTINLSWNHPDPASVNHYLILNRREGFGDGQLTQVGTSTTTSFAHDGLEPESTYFYRVTPVNAEGEEGQRSPRAEATTPAEATTEPDPTPAPPQQSDATTRTSHHVLVSNLGQSSQTRTGTTDSWSMPFTTGPDPRGYPVASVVIKYYSDNAFDVSVCTVDADDHPTSTCTALDPPSNFRRGNLTFTAPADTTLDPNTTYALFLDSSAQLVTLNLTGSNEDSGGAPGWSIGDNYANVYNGVWTDRGSALLIGINGSESYTAPDAPRWRIVHAKGETEISLSWAAPDNHDGAAITGYKIEVSPNGISDWSNLVRDTKSSSLKDYTHTGLSAGTTRFYRVSAINSVDAGTASNAAGATTAAPNVLVSNTGQYADPEDVVGIGDQDKTNSQGFDTGTYSGQYSLDSVGVYVHDQSPSAGETLNVHIYTNRAGGPNTLEYTLTSPASYTSRAVNTFTAPHGATLDANKSYHVVFEANGDSATDFVLGAVESNSQDISARTAWDIENAYRFNGTLTNTRNSFQISVNGRPIGVPVPETWGLIPNGLSIGDEFRLMFLSSTKQNANQAGINPYDSFIQRRANAGHDDIKQYKSRFRAIGCTLSTHANIHTGTLYTTSDKGLPIYWLNGNKVVDNYEDFYDGSWDDEDNNKNELGANGLDTSDPDNYPLTGCDHDGTPGDNRLGTNTPAVGVPNSSVEGDGPLSSGTTTSRVANHPMYGLSPIFRIVDAGDATLANLSIEGATDGESITLSPAFDADTFTYTASVPTDIEAVKLRAFANDSKAMAVISNDDDTRTQNQADLNIGYGDNTLTVTVTAIDTLTTQSYTITVTRTAPPASKVPLNWSLVPTGLNTGDQFRLIFLSSTKRDATSTTIDDYNTFVQTLAADGHSDIQAYSDGFTVVGCTSTFDARNNTATLYTTSDKGVPIYWLDGNKVADEYEDFYDGSWDDEANNKNESGSNGPDTSQVVHYPLTGCSDSGTKATSAGDTSEALGATAVRIARPNSTGTDHGPLSSSSNVLPADERPMYGISAVFQVGEFYSLVPDTWSLKPIGLGVGDEFRLIFLSSTKRNASSSDIADYNTFIQDLVTNGHDNIQAYSDHFTAVGCTEAVDARNNTSTRHDSADRGVPIYWLNGAKAADQYQDFYDGSWSDEANPKNELGNNGPDTSIRANYPLTGCGHNGTEAIVLGTSRAFGKTTVTVGRPNDTSTGSGPIGSSFSVSQSNDRPMYGISQVFQVVAPPMLSDLAIETSPDGQTVPLTPAFDADTYTYTASIANRINAVQLTATKKSASATVAITSDDDTSTANRANLNLSVGTNTLTVTVTAENETTQTYTVTVTRAAEPPAPIDCPADTDWCTTMGVGYTTSTTVGVKIEFQGYRSTASYGDLRTATFSHAGTSYAVTQLYVHKNTLVTTNAVSSNSLNLVSNPPLPDGAALQLGNRIFTVDADSAGSIRGTEQWNILSDPLNWTDGQHVTTSLKLPSSDDATLSNLAIEGTTNGETITLSPTFNADTPTYSAIVPNEIDTVTLTATTTDSNATVVITNDDDTSSKNQAELALDVGDTILTVTVTSQGAIATITYTITVTRAAPSNDATLSALTITGPSGGKPATLYPDFDAEITDYTTWVANRIDAVKLTATKTDSSATIVITNDDDSNTPGEAQFNLNFAANAFEITVTAQDGLTTRTYNVNVNRATALPPAPTNCPADTNWCATMTVGYASQSLGETTKEEYWGYEANQIHGELTATTFVYGGTTYTVTDLYRYKNFDTETNAVYGDYLDLITSPGLPAGTVLQVDTRTFTTGPESSTGTSGEEQWDIQSNPVNWRFSQNVTASLKLPPSMNATLQGLTLQGSTGGEAITLSPEFALGTTVYTASVVNRIDAVKLTATLTDSNATVTITGDDDTNSKNEAKLNLIVGANTLTVTVTAADGNATQDYTITATRAAAPPAPTDCPTDTTWCTTLVLGYSPISADGFTTETFGYLPSSNFGDLGSTTFSHGETSYTVSSIFRTRATNDSDGVVQSDNITIIFSPEIPDDTVFQIDTRTFTVDMDSEGASSGQEQWDLTADPPVWTAGQHVTVSLKFPSNDATLMALALTDTSDDSAITLTPQFEAPTESYAAPVFYNTDQITIVPTTTEPNATFGFLDRNDLEIADANSSQDGFQFNLAVFDNTVKVRVTAHDGIATKTYTVVVTRMDTTEPPLVTITADSPAVNYSPDDDATFTVTRASTFAVALTVNLHMTQNKLFLAAPDLARVVTIPSGSRSATLTITGAELQLVDSDPVETGTLTATVAPGTGYVIGSPASASVNIVPFMTVRIERVSYTVPEDVGTFAIKVIARTGNDAPQPASDFTVSLITQDGTAEQGQDYNLFDADITFQTGDFSRDGNAWKAEKTVMLTITDDLLDEPDQAFTLNLKRPNNLDYRILVVNSDNAAPRNQHQSTITIQDNDLAMPQVNFASSTYTVTEGNFVDIQVTLSEDPEQTVTIPLTVTNQGGTTSDDYSVQTSLTFTNNQTSMFTRFSALTDTADDDGESVIIAFGTIPTGLVAGTVTETVVSISNAEIRAETEIARLLSATQQHLLGCALFDSISLLGAGDTYRVNTDYARCVPLRDVYTDTCLSPDQTDHFDRQRITVFRELGLAVALMSMVDSARLLYSNTMLPTNNDGYASEAAQGFVRPNVIVALYPSLKRLYVNFAGTEDAYSIEDQAFEFADGQIYGPEMEFLLQRMQAIVDRNYYFPAPECRFDNDIRDRVKHPAGAEEDLGSIQTGVPRQGELDNGPDVDLFETTLIQGTTYVITAIPVDPSDVDLAKVNFQSLSTNKVVEQVQPRVQVMDTDGNELASGTEREPATYTATTGGTHHVRVTHANETDHKNAGIYILLLRTPDEFTGPTLSTLTLQDTTDGGNIILVPDFDPDTHSYMATAPNRITSVKLTATTTNVDVKATIANDDDTNTPHEAELNLNVGSNTLSVTVTAADRITTKTYTITVNRTAPPPAPTDCPADTDWCTTMKVGYQTIPAPGFTTEQFGFLAAANFGDLGSTTFTHTRTSYTVSEIYRIKSTRESDNVVQVDQLSIQTSTTLPDGTVLKLGSRTFTVDTDSETTILGQEQWNLRADPPVWTSGQNVTVSLKLPSTTATLSALTVNDGTSDLTLTPTFIYATYAYKAEVGNATTRVTLTATLHHDTDEISSVTLGGTAIADTNFADGIAVPSLVVGTNQIVITVTNPNTSTAQTYTVTVTRISDDITLVSNTRQATDLSDGILVGTVASDTYTQAQQFTTGDNEDGYTLSSVQIYIRSFIGSSRARVSIYGADSSGDPDSRLFRLTNPSPIANNSLNTFTAPANQTLAKETKYFVAIEATSDNFAIGHTSSNAEDTGHADGWTINNQRHVRSSDSGSWSTSPAGNTNIRINLSGTFTPDIEIPFEWSLIPAGLGSRDRFRLIFLSSTKRDGSSTTLSDYNSFIQNRAAAGHPDILVHSANFSAVGCTQDIDARDNTGTFFTSSDKGVPIYWLGGAKVADQYEDFYDGNWDDEANPKDESGANGPNIDQSSNFPITGCNPDGTEKFVSGNSKALGTTSITVGVLDAANLNYGPISSDDSTASSTNRPMYGLSAVFRVEEVSDDATLSDLTIERTTGGENITLNPAFDADTFTYTATAHHRIDAVTLTATKTDSLATVVITGDDTSTPNTADLDLSVGTNTLTVTVTAEDTSTTLTYTITVTRERDPKEPVNVPPEWGLIPRGLNVGDQFRLLFLTATRRDGSSPVIGDYNTFVRARAAAGHTDIQEHSDRFTVVGCTEDTDARNNTGTRYTNSNKGVPIYWLDGNNVADDYEDFYDGSWDDEANDKNEDGNDAHNTSNDANFPLTGCSDDGTEKTSASVSSALGNGGDVTIARPDSSNSNHGPLSSNGTITNTFTRPMYGISPVFLVAVTNDATLRSLAIETTTGGETVNLTPPFVPSTSTYTAEVPNGTDAVKLTAAANNSNSTVAITGDPDINTLNEADFDLVVGDNTLTLTVTAEDGNALTYTITVTRADVTRNTATLKAATGQNVPLSPTFDTGTYTYTATVANRIETVKLEAATNESNSTIAITGDDDTGTPDEAEFGLNVGGANIITFTVTPEDDPPVTYTITVTRGEAPPEPTDCPAVNDWCATLKVGYDSDISSTVTDEYWGYETRQSYGDLTSTTFTYDAIEYTVTDLYRYRNSDSYDNTVLGETLNLEISPNLPDSTVLQVGTRTFTTGTDSFTGTVGIEEWNIKGAPLDWTSNQNVTVSLTFPRAPILPWDGQTVHDVKQRQTHTISNAGDSVWFSAADLKENGLYQFIYYDAAQEQSVADRTIKLYSPDGNPVVHHGYTLASDGQTPTFQVIPDEDGTYYLQVSSTTNDTGQFWIFYADRSLRSPKGDRSGTTLQQDCGGGLNTACRLFEPDSAVQGHLKADDLDNFRFALRKGGETRVCANFLDNPLSDVTWTDGNAPASENLQFSVGSPNSKWPRLYIEEAGLNCTQYFTPTFTGLYDVYVSLLTSLGPTECSTCDPPRPSNPYRDDLAAHPNQHDDYEVWFEVRGAR